MVDASNYEYDYDKNENDSSKIKSNKVSFKTDEDIIQYMQSQQNKNVS
ncbi:hypothetical protein Ga0061079_1183 [Apibacter mensalis]|uniref:Uncharacterized protein n=1 Tax=Apibacter mensalis TaxID=1586267 RepID=A0A0X3AS51_9FLAO|nr:hypothetical protein Ga0061079_1183 [Apibacter mensalis]